MPRTISGFKVTMIETAISKCEDAEANGKLFVVDLPCAKAVIRHPLGGRCRYILFDNVPEITLNYPLPSLPKLSVGDSVFSEKNLVCVTNSAVPTHLKVNYTSPLVPMLITMPCSPFYQHPFLVSVQDEISSDGKLYSLTHIKPRSPKLDPFNFQQVTHELLKLVVLLHESRMVCDLRTTDLREFETEFESRLVVHLERVETEHAYAKAGYTRGLSTNSSVFIMIAISFLFEPPGPWTFDTLHQIFPSQFQELERLLGSGWRDTARVSDVEVGCSSLPKQPGVFKNLRELLAASSITPMMSRMTVVERAKAIDFVVRNFDMNSRLMPTPMQMLNDPYFDSWQLDGDFSVRLARARLIGAQV